MRGSYFNGFAAGRTNTHVRGFLLFVQMTVPSTARAITYEAEVDAPWKGYGGDESWEICLVFVVAVVGYQYANTLANMPPGSSVRSRMFRFRMTTVTTHPHEKCLSEIGARRICLL